MPISLAFRFVAGRYHATPSGHHVNEGLIEWPPSPWRLLRALISVGYTSGTWDAAGPPDTARRLLGHLSADLPHYSLPAAAGAHSRHYMPVGVLDPKTRVEQTTLVFDTWARVADQELVATWRNVLLDDAERAMLVLLAERLNYLGRSESWVEGRVIGDGQQTPDANCFPEERLNTPGRGWEQIVLLAPEGVSAYATWRAARLEETLADLQLPEGRKPAKALLAKRARAADAYPTDLLDCLQKDTTWLRSHGWNRPPGSRRVFYWRPADAVSVGAPKARAATRVTARVKAMLLSLTNARRNDHALPPVIRTLPQAELLHGALVGISARNGVPPPELTGRDANRRPLRGPHEHAHINPLDLDGDGHLDHVLVWAPGGLGAEAQAAIRAARKTFTKGAIEPLRLGLAATGDLTDIARLSGVYGRRVAGLTRRASSWQSVTPFVPPRYVKARGKNTVEGQIRAELHLRGFPDPVTVAALGPMPRGKNGAPTPGASTSEGGGATWRQFRHFKLARQRGPDPPLAWGLAVRLEFAVPVGGPIAIGYGSHFGLGLFECGCR